MGERQARRGSATSHCRKGVPQARRSTEARIRVWIQARDAPGVWELRSGGRSKTVRGSSKDANTELAKLVAATTGRQAPNGSTLQELLDQWLPDAPLERETKKTYTAALKHLPEKLGRTKIGGLELRMFDRAYTELDKAGVSAHQIRKLHTVICSALMEAMRWRWIDHHPAHDAHLPKIPERTPTVPDLDDLAPC